MQAERERPGADADARPGPSVFRIAVGDHRVEAVITPRQLDHDQNTSIGRLAFCVGSIGRLPKKEWWRRPQGDNARRPQSLQKSSSCD